MPLWFHLPTMQKQDSEELLLNANPTSLVSKFADVSTRLWSIVVRDSGLAHRQYGGGEGYHHSFKIPGKFGHLFMLLAFAAKITGYLLSCQITELAN